MAPAWEPVKRLAHTLTDLGVETMPEVLVADDPADASLHTTGQLGSPLLIVGAHDAVDADHPALGRVSLDVVRCSTDPVLVVPARVPRMRCDPLMPEAARRPGPALRARTGASPRAGSCEGLTGHGLRHTPDGQPRPAASGRTVLATRSSRWQSLSRCRCRRER
jgi:hypothetical protein